MDRTKVIHRQVSAIGCLLGSSPVKLHPQAAVGKSPSGRELKSPPTAPRRGKDVLPTATPSPARIRDSLIRSRPALTGRSFGTPQRRGARRSRARKSIWFSALCHCPNALCSPGPRGGKWQSYPQPSVDKPRPGIRPKPPSITWTRYRTMLVFFAHSSVSNNGTQSLELYVLELLFPDSEKSLAQLLCRFRSGPTPVH